MIYKCGSTAPYLVAPLVSSGSVPGTGIAESGTAAGVGVVMDMARLGLKAGALAQPKVAGA